MSRPLKILVAGYLVGFPLGGMAWMLLHYVLGLRRMGHEVLVVEDSHTWSYPFNPELLTYSEDCSYGCGALNDFLGHFDLADRWVYYNGFADTYCGRGEEYLDRFCKDADLLLNISGLIPMRERYMQCRTKILIDTDPVLTQVRGADKPAIHAYYLNHDACFTYGCNLSRGHTPVPLLDIDWKPILPPVLLEEWTPLPSKSDVFTTIGSWDPKDRDILIAGERYSWRKSVEYEKIIDLPKRVAAGTSFELAYSGMEEDAERYAAHGWRIRDGFELSRDFWGYRDYIRASRGEFTVAKDQNIRLASGWFSDRAATYLASGRPVITQDCGTSTYLPEGEGLYTFRTMDDILAAAEAIEAEPERNRQAALAIARDYFDARKVLGGMLKEVGLA